MRNNSDLSTSAEDLVLTVRRHSPVRKSVHDDTFSNSNIENIPEPVFFMNTGELKAMQSESPLLEEVESLKLQLKAAKNSNLESKVAIEGVKNELKDKIRAILDLNSQMEKLNRKLKETELAQEEEKIKNNSHEERLTRFYDQKLQAYKAQVADLEGKLGKEKHDHDVERKKLETEVKLKLDQAGNDIKAKDARIGLLEDENQMLIKAINEINRSVELSDSSTQTFNNATENMSNDDDIEMQKGLNNPSMNMMNGMGMIPTTMMMPFCYSMASMMMANMEMSRMISMSTWPMAPMMQSQSYHEDGATSNIPLFGPQNISGPGPMVLDPQQFGYFPGSPIKSWQTNEQNSSDQLECNINEEETKQVIASNSECTPLKSPEMETHTVERMTPVTVTSSGRKRSYEESGPSERAEKKTSLENKKEERKRDSRTLDPISSPRTPTSDSKRVDDTVIIGAKWVSDGKGGFESVDTERPSASPEHSFPSDIYSSENSEEDRELELLMKERRLHQDDDILFKCFAKCSVLFPSQLRPRILIEKGILVVIVNHTSDRSFPYRIIVSEPHRGSRLMNVAMYDNVRISQEGTEIIVKILHRRKGAPDSTACRHSKYIMNLKNVQIAASFYDAIFPPKRRR